MSTLIFCRHAQTLYNKNDRFQGLSDSPLTYYGKDQANKVAVYIKNNFSVDNFFLSPANRVFETYKIFKDVIKTQHGLLIDSRLREICYGDWEGFPRASIDSSLLKLRQRARYTFVHPGNYRGINGQSYADVYDRVVNFINYVEYFISANQFYKDVCCITHHGVLINVLRYFLNLKLNKLNNLKIKNNTIVIIQDPFRKNSFKLKLLKIY